MAKKVKYYLVYFQDNDGNKINVDIAEFFKNLQDMFANDELNMPQFYHDKRIYMFQYIAFDYSQYTEFVIPFGKMKTNAPYKKSEENIKVITPETEELFDVNLFYYSQEYDVAILTTEKDGPNSKAIETFLNCFIKDKSITLRIRPILHSFGIEKIRESKKVRTISLNINLDSSLNNYFHQNINSDVGLLKGILNLLNTTKEDANCKTIKLELGMGHYKNYMDFDNAMALLTQLEISDSDIFKEITVNYMDGHSEKIETVKIKNPDVELYDLIHNSLSGAILSSELIKNAKNLLDKHIYKINKAKRTIIQSMRVLEGIEIQQGERHVELQKTTI